MSDPYAAFSKPVEQDNADPYAGFSKPVASSARPTSKIIDLGDKGPPTSRPYREAVAALPIGQKYRDYQGNVRENRAGPRMLTDPRAGNPIVKNGVFDDIVGAGRRGLVEGAQGVLDLAGNIGPLGVLNAALPRGLPKPYEIATMAGLGAGSALARAVGQDEIADRMQRASLAPTARQRNANFGGEYKSQTLLGKGARYVGQMVAGAALPGSIAARVANVAVPAAGALIGGEIGGAIGGETGEDIGGVAGGIIGGLGSGLRFRTAPADVDPVALQAALDNAPMPEGVNPRDYQKAVAYVARLAEGAGKSPEDIAAVSGRGVTAAEAIGRPAQSGLGALAIREGQTGPAFEARIAERQIGRPERLLSDVAEAGQVDPEFARGDIEAMVKAGQKNAAPLYRAYEAEAPATSPRLEDLLRRPTIREAWSEAQRMARNAGDDPYALGLVDMETPGAWDRMAPPDAPMGPAAVPRGLQGGKPSQGPSLAKFIADGGGVKDATGELSAMDMDAFHRGKAFQRKLVGDGDSLDGWAVKAWERGYFPGDEPPTPNQVLDALAAEARGQPLYAREADAMAGQRQAFLEAEAERVARGGDAPIPSPEDYTGGPMPVNEPVAAQVPSWKALDLLKKAADQKIKLKYRNSLTNKLDTSLPGAMDEIAVVAQLRDEIALLNPKYGEALGVAGEYLQSKSAYEFGQSALFKPQFDARDFAKRVGKMTDAEVKAVRSGIANDILQRMMNGYLRPSLFKTPAVKAKLQAAFGREATDWLLKAMESEAAMLAFEGRYAPGAGPKSAEMLEAMRAQDEAGAFSGHIVDLGTTALTQGKTAAMSEAVRKVAGWAKSYLKTATMGVPVRDIAGDLLMSDPERLAAVLEARRLQNPPRGALSMQYRNPINGGQSALSRVRQ